MAGPGENPPENPVEKVTRWLQEWPTDKINLPVDGEIRVRRQDLDLYEIAIIKEKDGRLHIALGQDAAFHPNLGTEPGRFERYVQIISEALERKGER